MSSKECRALVVSSVTSTWIELEKALDAADCALEHMGMEVDPAEIVSRAREREASIVIDLKDNLLHGMEVLSACRRLSEATPIIVVAENASVELARSIREAGVFYLALHPLSAKILDHLGLPSLPPRPKPRRLGQADLFEVEAWEGEGAGATFSAPARAPPAVRWLCQPS